MKLSTRIKDIIDFFLGYNQGGWVPAFILKRLTPSYFDSKTDSWKIGPFLVETPNWTGGDTFFSAFRRGNAKIRFDKF